MDAIVHQPEVRRRLAWLALSVLVCANSGARCPITIAQLDVGNQAVDASCDYDTIQKAIDAVATCPVIINITNWHTYDENLSIQGQPVAALVGWGDGVSCQSLKYFCPISGCVQTDTQPQVMIDGNHNGSVLSISGTSNVTLRNLTLTHGQTAYDGSGGGIYFGGSGTLSLIASTVSYSYAGYGGGIDISPSGDTTLNLLSNTILIGNTAQFSGGGIRIEGATRLKILDDPTLITYNHALGFDPDSNSASGGYGGGIEILGPARADIGSPGDNGEGVIAHNDGIYGAGIAVVDNGNGQAVLRTFAHDAAHPTSIENNEGATNGGGVFVTGYADACLFASRIAGNIAEDGAAIYQSCNVAGTDNCVPGGVYINGGAPSQLGTECGPEPVSALGGTTDCLPYDSQCSVLSGNATKHLDYTPSAGATVRIAGGDLAAARVRMRDNIAAHLINLFGQSEQISRCLLTGNSVSDTLVYSLVTLAEIRGCTISHNTIDGGFVFDMDYSSVKFAYDIIDQPGKYSINWYDLGGIFGVSYVLTNNLSGLPQNVSIVQGAPIFVDAADGDFHLAPVAQTALDFGVDTNFPTGFDLDGNYPVIDLPTIPNYLPNGAADLGAYERQNLFDSCGNRSDTLFCDGFEH